MSEVTPDDIIHFTGGILSALNDLIDKCPNEDFRGSMKFGIIDLSWKMKYWKKVLEDIKNDRVSDLSFLS